MLFCTDKKKNYILRTKKFENTHGRRHRKKLAAQPTKTAGAALRTFFNIATAWGLNETEAMTLLGFDERTRSTYFKWKRAPESARLTKEKLERLSYIFGIYKDLQILLPKTESADGWVRRPNDAMPLAVARH